MPSVLLSPFAMTDDRNNVDIKRLGDLIHILGTQSMEEENKRMRNSSSTNTIHLHLMSLIIIVSE